MLKRRSLERRLQFAGDGAISSGRGGVRGAWPSLLPERQGDRRACQHPEVGLTAPATNREREQLARRRQGLARPPLLAWRGPAHSALAAQSRGAGEDVQIQNAGRRPHRRYPHEAVEPKGLGTATGARRRMDGAANRHQGQPRVAAPMQAAGLASAAEGRREGADEAQGGLQALEPEQAPQPERRRPEAPRLMNGPAGPTPGFPAARRQAGGRAAEAAGQVGAGAAWAWALWLNQARRRAQAPEGERE